MEPYPALAGNSELNVPHTPDAGFVTATLEPVM
jgi:hypothetical protein